jgi:hypothetical protein
LKPFDSLRRAFFVVLYVRYEVQSRKYEIRNTGIKLMSNAERRLKIEEVEIRKPNESRSTPQ